MLKTQNYFLAKTYFHILKSLTHGNYKLLISQKYFFYKIYGNYAHFFHNQLITKVHVYHLWQNYSFCREDQAQRSWTTRPSWAGPAHMQISAAEAHVSCQVQVQHNLTTGTHYHQFQLIKSYQRRTRLAGVKPFLTKFIFIISHVI